MVVGYLWVSWFDVVLWFDWLLFNSVVHDAITHLCLLVLLGFIVLY